MLFLRLFLRLSSGSPPVLLRRLFLWLSSGSVRLFLRLFLWLFQRLPYSSGCCISAAAVFQQLL
jgi:hypothetical protein